MNSEYEKLIAECLTEMEAVPPMTAAERANMETWLAHMDVWHTQEHPTPCLKTKNCRRAGGCYECLVLQPRCWETDRTMNRECWERGIFGPPRTEKERACRAKAKRVCLP